MSEHTYSGVYLYKRIVQAKLFMDGNFTNNIDLDDIADEGCFSRFHFLRLFKKIYGRTPHQYLVYLRIERAKELLKTGSPVSEVCYAVGFESLGSFSILFKRHCSITPSEYQSAQRDVKHAIHQRPLTFVPDCFARAQGWLQ